MISKKKIKIKNILGRIFNENLIKEDSLIELELSNICNANCIFCPYIKIKETNKKFRVMNDKIFSKVLKIIEKDKYQKISFTPTTGEILINKDWDKFIRKVFDLKNIKRVLFYSNAILLNEINQEKLISLIESKNSKLKDIHFSVGGIERKTYNLMYGVDKFEQVKNNINSLLKKIKEKNLKIKIVIELRIPNYQNLSTVSVENCFNEVNYQNLKINILKEFIKIPCLEKNENLDYLPTKKIEEQKVPCDFLYKIRFDVLGNIWADGCVISEAPNNFELKLGTVDDNLKKINENRKKLIKEWKKGNIPMICQGCSFYSKYKNDEIELEN